MITSVVQFVTPLRALLSPAEESVQHFLKTVTFYKSVLFELLFV